MELLTFGTRMLMYRQNLNVSMIASIIRQDMDIPRDIINTIASKKENILLIALNMNAKVYISQCPIYLLTTNNDSVC